MFKMLRLVQEKMKALNNIHIVVVFKDIMNCFFISCGITLLLCFFGFDTFAVTKTEISKIVCSIFLQLLTLWIFYVILLNKSRWFCNDELNVSVKTINPSIEKAIECDIECDKEIEEYNRKVTAVHEAGHAVMSYLKNTKDYIIRVTDTEGYIKHTRIFKMAAAEEIKEHILIVYAGAIAEELLMGKFHWGCSGSENADFDKATRLLKQYIIMTNPDVSKSLLDTELADRVIELSKTFYKEAQDTLCQNKNLIEVLAKELMVKNYLSKEEVASLLEQ